MFPNCGLAFKLLTDDYLALLTTMLLRRSGLAFLCAFLPAIG